MLVVKNPPAKGGVVREVNSIPGLGRSLGGAVGNSLIAFLPGESPWAEEPSD